MHTHRLLAACLLDRAAQRLRDAKTPDPEVEVLLGETAEELAVTGGPFRAELGLSEKSGATGTRGFYDAAAFQRAVDLLGGTITLEQKRVRDRAQAGLLRAQFRERPSSLAGLVQESNAWLGLLETSTRPRSCARPPTASAKPLSESADIFSPSASSRTSRSSKRASARPASACRERRRIRRTAAGSRPGRPSSTRCAATARRRFRRKSRSAPAGGSVRCASTESSAP